MGRKTQPVGGRGGAAYRRWGKDGFCADCGCGRLISDCEQRWSEKVKWALLRQLGFALEMQRSKLQVQQQKANERCWGLQSRKQTGEEDDVVTLVALCTLLGLTRQEPKTCPALTKRRCHDVSVA